MGVETPVATFERVWEVATRGKLADIEALLRTFSSAQRMRDAYAMALRGVEAVLRADVPRGIALLRRAVESSTDEQRPYFVDLLVPYVVSVGDLAGAEDILDDVHDVGDALAPAFLASRSVLAARQGYDKRSREYAAGALEHVWEGENPMILARTLQRVGLAAFYREDYDEAQERSLEAARAYERINAFRAAANAYTVLYAIAVGWLGDPDIARSYAARIATIAKLDGDLSMQNLGLVAQLEIAAESGDDRRFGSLRARLLANPLHEQYRERFSFVVAEVLTNGWGGRFQPARSALGALKKRQGLSASETMLCDALLGLLDVARWETDDARKVAHAVLSRTAARPAQEPLYDAQRRKAARIIAAATCILTGEAVRGRRALSRAFDPDGQFARLDPARGIDESAVPALMRGYAKIINAVCTAAASNRPQLGLTKAELEVLRALPSGQTVAEIADGLRRSKRTIDRRLGTIYQKLGVVNRTQAIETARSLGLDL